MRNQSNPLIARFDALVASQGLSTDTKAYKKLRTAFFRDELMKINVKIATGDGKAIELRIQYEELINQRGSQNCITQFNRRRGIFEALKDTIETRFAILPETQALEYNSYAYRQHLRSFLKEEYAGNKAKFHIEIKSVKDKLFRFEALVIQRGLVGATREHALLRQEILGDPNQKVKVTKASPDELAAKLGSLKINYDSDTPDSDSSSEDDSDWDDDSDEEEIRLERLRRKLPAAREATQSSDDDDSEEEERIERLRRKLAAARISNNVTEDTPSPINPSVSNPTQRTETRAQRANREFNEYFGNATKLENWQRLCRDLGIEPVPGSITQCRKAMETVWINIYDFLEQRRNGKPARRFETETQLANYCRKTGKIFPRKLAKEEGALRGLLAHISRPGRY